MIKESIEKALNNQVNEEFYSSYLYLAMSAFFESKNLTGFAKWMKLQSSEEYLHAEKIYNFIHQKGGVVNLTAIKQPKTKWESVVEVFEDTYKHEQHISSSINDIVDLALKEKDHATAAFLQWFVNEQVEEEATALKILEDVKMVSGNPNGMFMLDRELGQRVPNANTAE